MAGNRFIWRLAACSLYRRCLHLASQSPRGEAVCTKSDPSARM